MCDEPYRDSVEFKIEDKKLASQAYWRLSRRFKNGIYVFFNENIDIKLFPIFEIKTK